MNAARTFTGSGIRKYATYFRIRFTAGLQYRAAAAAGVATQFAWGFLTVLLYKAFWEADPDAFPMGIAQVTSYMWLRQAFLAMFNSWTVDGFILSDITGGNIAYELVRPLDIYALWFTKNFSMRAANVTLRFLPVLIVAAVVPAPYGMSLPAGVPEALGFLVTMILGAFVTCALIMFIYIFTFFTMQPGTVNFWQPLTVPMCMFLTTTISAFSRIRARGMTERLPAKCWKTTSGTADPWDWIFTKTIFLPGILTECGSVRTNGTIPGDRIPATPCSFPMHCSFIFWPEAMKNTISNGQISSCR